MIAIFPSFRTFELPIQQGKHPMGQTFDSDSLYHALPVCINLIQYNRLNSWIMRAHFFG